MAIAPNPPNRLTFNQGLPSNTTVAHLTDTKTGNVYPVVVAPGTSAKLSNPTFISGTLTQNSRTVSGAGQPAGGSGVWWSPNSTNPPTYAKPNGSSCQLCQSPMFPWLIVGGVLLVVLILAASHRS